MISFWFSSWINSKWCQNVKEGLNVPYGSFRCYYFKAGTLARLSCIFRLLLKLWGCFKKMIRSLDKEMYNGARFLAKTLVCQMSTVWLECSAMADLSSWLGQMCRWYSCPQTWMGLLIITMETFPSCNIFGRF